MDAIILAAGMGSRIREHHQKPKGFIKMGGSTLIEQSLKILKYFGIYRILIVTGYQHQAYDKLAQEQANVDTILNSEYENSGSLYSWHLAKQWVQNDFLLLESDILFDEAIIEQVLGDQNNDLIAVSTHTGAHDAVYISTNGSYLSNMSKDLQQLKNCYGELIGINKFSANTYQKLIATTAQSIEINKHQHYETEGLVELAQDTPIYCLQLNELAWCEIDDYAHWRRAQELWPNIRKKTKIFTELTGSYA